MAFVLVQHLDPKHSSELRDILARTTKIPVEEVTDGMTVRADHIYVIPPNTSMVLKNRVLRLAARVLTRGQHMPIDHFLRSLADDLGPRAIGVILSGTASDGTEGVRAVKAAGGITFAQDEKSAKYAGMPHSAVSARSVDFVLPPAAIARELARVARHPYLAPTLVEKTVPAVTGGDQLGALLALLRDATGVDFTHYKQTTLQRRITRRMVVHKLEKLKDYVRYVRDTPGEVEELYQDILIHVTGFFRDPEAFEALQKHVFPALFQDNKQGGTSSSLGPRLLHRRRGLFPCHGHAGVPVAGDYENRQVQSGRRALPDLRHRHQQHCARPGPRRALFRRPGERTFPPSACAGSSSAWMGAIRS